MNAYLAVKVVHIISSTILFGTGLGIAYFKWIVDRSGNIAAIRVVSERVVLADWIFTTPSIITQAITGIVLASLVGYPIMHGWVMHAILLYIFAGACWLPVVWLQIRMRDLARAAEFSSSSLSDRYWFYSRLWFWLGVPAFLSLIAVFWLMIVKPS